MEKKNECSHILNIFEQEEKPKNKGNLYLSGVNVLRDPLFKFNFDVNCVVTVIDKKTYHGCKVQHKIEQQGIEHHKWFQIDDYPEQSILPFFDEAHLYIREKLNDHNVLVHCMMGKSRSSSIVIAFLMKEYSVTYEQARDWVRQQRSIITPNKGFIKDLCQFQKILAEKKEGEQKEEVKS